MPKCPMSEFGARSLKTLSESYDILVTTAARLEQTELVPETQKRRAWRRAERAGRLIDNLLLGWEQEACPSLFHSCAWEQCERSLAVVNCLTPLGQWDLPQLALLWQTIFGDNTPQPPPDKNRAPD